MRVALVHDYLNEFGGAERVLLALSEIWPKAPIYTAFIRPGSEAAERFADKKVITSWAQHIPGFNRYLYSPLRFLAPTIWGSVAKKIKGYDVVISSSSWYVTKGFGAKKEICYCHTPPRWLYGYKTSMNWQKYWPVRVYGQIIGHFMRQYDYWAAQKVTHFVANSEEVRRRIKKFYRRDSTVIYPPANLVVSSKQLVGSKEEDYYLIVSRLVGGKGIELGVKAANKGKFKLKIVGEGPLEIETSKYVELVEQVKDEELAELYAKAKGFLALSRDEDFGITPVEAMSVGTGVVAYNGGGYQETVVDGKTGVLFDDYSVDGLVGAIKRLKKLKIKPKDCINQAKKFSKSRFKREMKKFVKAKALT